MEQFQSILPTVESAVKICKIFHRNMSEFCRHFRSYLTYCKNLDPCDFRVSKGDLESFVGKLNSDECGIKPRPC